jgi:hypothetical protein
MTRPTYPADYTRDHAVRTVEQLPHHNGQGYRVRFTACTGKASAEALCQREQRDGFPAEVLQVSRDAWEAIKRGDWNTYKPTPGL